MWHSTKFELKVPVGCWARHWNEEELFQLNMWHIVHGLPHGLLATCWQDCEGAWLLIELRICSDPRAASFICLIIVERGGDTGGGMEGEGLTLRFHSKKLGCLNQLFTVGGCHQR